MEAVMEALMVVCLCAAVGIMLYRFATNRCVHKGLDRLTVATIGIGFIFGGACKTLMDPIPWLFDLYIVGAWLCYSTFIFSLPCKEEQSHE